MLIVHRNYIVITGDAGSAALALAQHVFSKPKVQSLYMMCLTITHINGKYGLEIFSSTLPEKWEEFKATFEKVCNNLAVFM